MIFKDTYRASPVSRGIDMPWEFDLFHHKPADIPKTKKEFGEFLLDMDIHVDLDWWRKQEKYCREGFVIDNAIEKGGDYLVDGEDAFWNDSHEKSKRFEYYDRDIVVPPNSVYLPEYDLTIHDRKLHVDERMYFYLNFWPIYRLKDDKTVKDVLNPKFIAPDVLYAARMKRMFKEQKDQSEAKARQQGFSEKGGGMIIGYNYHFIRSSVNIVAGGMSDDADHTVENFIRGADFLINTQFYKERSKNSSDVIIAKDYKSEVRAISCKDNAQALSRFSPYWVIYEEVGKWKKGLITDAKGFVDASLQAESHKTGWSTYIGTGGDMEEGAADLEEIHYNPKRFNVLEYRNKFEKESNVNGMCGHFTKSTCLVILDDDGNPNVAESKKFILKERATKKGKDKYNHTTQRALYAGDAFMISSGGYFGEEIAMNCNARLSYINTHKEAQIVERGYLFWVDRNDWRKGVEWEANEDGPFMIAEHPKVDSQGKVYSNLYRSATDSYDQDESYTSTSQGSMWVKKGFLNANSSYNKYVAGVEERPKTSEGGREAFYEHTALLCAYYNARNLIEHSKILIIDWYQRKGLTDLLKLRPEFVIAKMVQTTQTVNQYGIDPATKPYWLKMHADYLKNPENINKCDFPVLLRAWAKFKYQPGKLKYNCDTTISTSLCTVLEEDEKEYMVIGSDNKPSPMKSLCYSMDSQGNIIQIYN